MRRPCSQAGVSKVVGSSLLAAVSFFSGSLLRLPEPEGGELQGALEEGSQEGRGTTATRHPSLRIQNRRKHPKQPSACISKLVSTSFKVKVPNSRPKALCLLLLVPFSFLPCFQDGQGRKEKRTAGKHKSKAQKLPVNVLGKMSSGQRTFSVERQIANSSDSVVTTTLPSKSKSGHRHSINKT